MKAWVRELVEHAITNNRSAKGQDKVAVAPSRGMQNDLQSANAIIKRVASKATRHVGNWKPALERLATRFGFIHRIWKLDLTIRS